MCSAFLDKLVISGLTIFLAALCVTAQMGFAFILDLELKTTSPSMRHFVFVVVGYVDAYVYRQFEVDQSDWISSLFVFVCWSLK